MSTLMNTVSRYILILFLFYLLWYKEVAGNMLMVLYGGAILCVISVALSLHKQSMKVLYIPEGLKWHCLFGFFCLISGLIVAKDNELLIKSLITYFSFLAICYLICIVSNKAGSFLWLYNSLILISLLSFLCIMIAPFDYYNGIMVKTLGEQNNPNTLAVVMFAGIFSLLTKYDGSLRRFFSILLLYLPFLYTIIETGSKKGLIAALLIFGIWLYMIKQNKKFVLSRTHNLIINTIIFTVIFSLIYYFTFYFVDTVSYQRLSLVFTSNSTLMRMSFYEEAINFFKESPLVGIGFSQFILHSQFGKYSHSTYAEVLACTGIIGTLLYFYPIIKCGKILFSKNIRDDYKAGIFLGLYIVEIFLGSSNIFMYEPLHMIFWTVLFYYSQDKMYKCR